MVQNKSSLFILHFFRNFGYAELTWHSEMKGKIHFPFAFLSLFRNFAVMKQCMVFAAGLGTRLRPLTDTMPKALVPVGGQPLLRHVILKLKEAGFDRIVITVHHFAEQIVDYLSANQNFGIDIRISDESDVLLETGGGIKKAQPMFSTEAPILIHNVDILSNVDLAAFYDYAANLSGDAMLLVSPRVTKRYLLFDDDMRLKGWTNIETGELRGPVAACADPAEREQTLRHRFAFSGIHVFHPALFEAMSQEPERFPVMDFYLKNASCHNIFGFLKEDLQLMDVGKLDTLDQAEQFIKSLIK